MKEPKFPKLEDIPRDHKYDFFAEGVFPDTEDQKLDTQKKSRLPFSLPVNVGKKISNTQKDDDLVPFFAKNYPSSSESKEEVCFINSPPPSDTPDNTGEAEEVEGEESESDDDGNKKDKKNEKNNNNKKNNNLNNDEIGVSVDFNSEMEYEYDNPSKMMSREEVQELMRKRKIQKEKEEQERKKKEEEEKRKKDEERKRKEEEKKRKEEEKKKKDEESKRKKDEESKKRKDEEKKKKEKEEKEKLKKIEEEKKKKIKSNKKDPLNLLSSIKKNYDDNSNMASNSMINDVQNFFAIPEEKGENEDEDEDTSKKNFKKNSIASEKKSKSKKNPKPITAEENKDKKEENANKSKNNKLSRKSNGLKANNEEEKKEKKPPKKEKVKEKKKPKKGNKAKKMTKNNEISVVQMYNMTMGAEGVKKIPYEIIQNEEEQTFGNGRYSRRNRIHTLNHELGERPKYVYDELGLPNLKYVIKANKNILYNSIMAKAEEIHNKKMKRLVKGLSHKNNETIPEESNEYNSDNLDSENISEYGEDDARILKIPKGGKKSLAKNYDTVLMIKIIEANGKNIIRVDKKEYKNLKNNNQVKVDKNQEFEILNFSDNFLVVQLVFDEDN